MFQNLDFIIGFATKISVSPPPFAFSLSTMSFLKPLIKNYTLEPLIKGFRKILKPLKKLKALGAKAFKKIKGFRR